MDLSLRIDTKNKLLKRIKIALYRTIVSFIKIFKKDDVNVLKAFWLKRTQNFGDSLNPILLNELSGKPVQWVKSYSPEIHYIAIGSILESATKDTIVWGVGFISKESQCFEKPKKVCAVRGPKSRNKLIEEGIECPEVYGDPALLLPKFYFPSVQKTYKLGVIPHFVDKELPWFKTIEQNYEVKIIDIQNNNIFAFIDEVLACEKIVSSSLHGIIISDAYNIPSLWVEFSKGVIGDGFKFLDYFLSVGRKDNSPFIIGESTSIQDLFKQFHDYEIQIDLQKLIDHAPFPIKDKYKNHTEDQ